MPSESKKLHITYSTSAIGVRFDQKDTIRRLGFYQTGPDGGTA